MGSSAELFSAKPIAHSPSPLSTSSDSEWSCSSDEPTAADHGHDVLYRIGRSDVVGRYMVADRDIYPGEIIFTDHPGAVGPDNSSRPMCLGCHRKVRGTFKCPGCRWPMCSDSCAKSALHRPECALFRSRGAHVVVPWFDKPCSYYDAILPIRVLLLKMTNPKVYKLVSLLMDHSDTIDENTVKHRQRVVDFVRKTCKLGADFSEKEVHHVLGILSVNSFVVHDTDEGHLDLIGLYPWTSLMSHHCIANTKITTREDFSYVCEATTFIPKGAEVTTSYHHYHYQLYGTQYRRRDLRSTWSFDCGCPRCADPTEAGTLVSAVICEKCKYGNLLPVNPLDKESPWRCDHCVLDTDWAAVDEKVGKFEAEIDDISGDNSAFEYEKLLRRMRYFFHENHYWVLDVKRKLIDIYGNKPGYELYKLPKDKLEKKIDFCEDLLNMAAKLCPGASEMRGYLLFESHGARLRLTQWKWIRMRITTNQYLDELEFLMSRLEEVVGIMGPIRVDSDEGQMGCKARDELRQLRQLKESLSRHTSSSGIAGSVVSLNEHRTSATTSEVDNNNYTQRRKSICF